MARKVWYADDAAAGGSLLQLKDWWSGLLSFGCHFGYYVNAAKTWLVAKEEYLASAQRIFNDSGIQIASAGRPYLASDLERELFGLPVSLGGLRICDPCRISTDDYNFSFELSRPLID